MKLSYKGTNEWLDEDYSLKLEVWQVPNYRTLVEQAERCTGRKLTQEEARMMGWLSGWEKDTCKIIAGIIADAYQNGRKGK